MRLEELSEIVFGKILDGSVLPAAISPGDLAEPYSGMVAYIKKNPHWTPESLVQEFGLYAIERARIAAASSESPIDIDWPLLLRRTAVMHRVGKRYAAAADSLMHGDSVDPAILIQEAYHLANIDSVVRRGDEIEPASIVLRPSFWQPLDRFVGGYPDASLTIVGATPGTGKTTLLAKLAVEAVKNEKKVLLFTMEMTAPQLMKRVHEIATLTDAERGRLAICDDMLSPSEVAAVAAKYAQDVHFIGIDFAELMRRDDGFSSESSMAAVYLTMQQTAKILRVPVVLLSQLNREYVGKLPDLQHLRYTGVAEIVGALIMFIYNPNLIPNMADTSGALPQVPGKGYIIVRKTKFGHKAGVNTNSFAVLVDWDGATGWGDKAGAAPFSLA